MSTFQNPRCVARCCVRFLGFEKIYEREIDVRDFLNTCSNVAQLKPEQAKCSRRDS